MNAVLDSKDKGKLEIIGLIIYLACGKTAKDLLRQEEARRELNLKGMENDEN